MDTSQSPRKVIASALTITAIIIAGLALSACGGTAETETQSTAPTPAPAEKIDVEANTDDVSLAASGDLLLAHGQFEGLSDHVTTGGITIVKRDGGVFVELGEDFSLDGAPDPVLGFGANGEYVAATQFSQLNEITGAQSYRLPDGIDLAEFDTVFVWCEKFSVPLGSASLSN